MDEEELTWMDLLAKSCALVRQKLNDGETPTDNELYHLINRAEALMHHLAKREQVEVTSIGVEA